MKTLFAPISPVTLQNGMEMNVPSDMADSASMGYPFLGNGAASLMPNTPGLNPMLANAMTGAKLQTMASLSHAAKYYDAHREIADEQAAVASELAEANLVAAHNDQIFDDLNHNMEHLKLEIEAVSDDSDDRILGSCFLKNSRFVSESNRQ